MILITGGAGFLGSQLALSLSDSKRASLAICDPALDHRPEILDGCDVVESVCPKSLTAFIQDYGTSLEAVFHLGAISSTSETDLSLLVDNNIRLTAELFEACGKNDIAFFYASSAAVYGDGSNGFIDDDRLSSIADLKPLNPYGWSKAMADLLVATFAATNSAIPTTWAGLRFFNVFGPGEKHKGEMQSPVPKFYEQIKKSGKVQLFRSTQNAIGDGEQSRDFVWVKDCVEVMRWLLDGPRVSGIINVGSGEANSFAELAESVCAAMGVEPSIEWVPTPQNIAKGYQAFTQADTRKLRDAGCELEFTPFKKAIALYVDELKANPPRA